jgi:sulfur relay protein TusB/DsrH
MILHKHTSNPFASSTLVDAIEKINAQDSVLLMQDAVYACSKPVLIETILKTTGNLYVLQDDLNARGVTVQNIGVQCIDYVTFVSLVVQHQNVVAWQ